MYTGRAVCGLVMYMYMCLNETNMDHHSWTYNYEVKVHIRMYVD